MNGQAHAGEDGGTQSDTQQHSQGPAQVVAQMP